MIPMNYIPTILQIKGGRYGKDKYKNKKILKIPDPGLHKMTMWRTKKVFKEYILSTSVKSYDLQCKKISPSWNIPI